MKGRQVVVTAKGGPENISIVESDVKEPAEDEVLIKVEYAGLAYADIMLRSGISMPGLPKPPFTPGCDAAGTVLKTGTLVTEFAPGDRVCALLMSEFGGQAQYLCTGAENVHKVPDDIPLEKSVCMLVNYITAYDMYSQYICESGDEHPVVLIHGGSGGVGTALIQIAGERGAVVYSTASESNLEIIEELGAKAIDYRSKDFVKLLKMESPEGVNVVFDPIGGTYLSRSLNVLKRGGWYFGYGFQAGSKKGVTGMIASLVRFLAAKLTVRNKNLRMYELQRRGRKEYAHSLQQLFDLYKRGRIDPLISDIIPLEEAARAHATLEKGQRRGKILIAA